MRTKEHLQALFEPRGIAVIGASQHAGKVGYKVLANIVESGFQGEIHPVHPSAETLLGLKVVHDVASLPRDLDLAVICLPPTAAVQSARELVERGVKALVVISAGFRETGVEGWRLEEELRRVAEQGGAALLGPNSLGLINTGRGLNASMAAGAPRPGETAFFSQSGALCAAVLDWAQGEGFGFSTFVSLGNKAGIDEADVLAWLAEDPATKVILGYVEGVEEGGAFLEQARRVARDKPVIVVKAGATAAGARAASAHTGSSAGSDQAYEAAFAQAGVMRVGDVETLFSLARAFATQPLPDGPGLAVVDNSGGPGVLAADACARSSLVMAGLTRETVDKLRAILPPYASLYNPVDVAGDAGPERFGQALRVVAEDPAVSSILALLAPTRALRMEEAAQAIVEAARAVPKPFVACLMGGRRVARAAELLQSASIPCYAFPEPAVAALDRMYRHWQRRNRPWPVPMSYRRDKPRAEAVVREAMARGVTELVEFQALDLLAAYELPTPRTVLARTGEEAVAEAEKIGFPVALKIASPQIAHKTDVDGVRLGLDSAETVRDAFAEIVGRARSLRRDAYVAGCLVQAMAPAGAKEVVVAFKRDEQFGPLVRFGLGGLYGETFRDFAYRLAPLSLLDAQEMAREIRTYPVLRGVRGETSVDFKALEDILLIMSQLAVDFPEIYEAEFNPVLVSAKGALVADVRAVLSPPRDAGI